MKRNVIVGQSGGPTAAINSSLAGVYHAAKLNGANKVYGMIHGIEGLLKECVVDLSDHIISDIDEKVLMKTPSAFLGSCRFKLPEIKNDVELYEKIFHIIDKLDVELFIYIGGNDSMDTIKKLSDYARQIGHTTRFVGCPKTIDNDLADTDHCPGYGSAAKYIAVSVKEIIRDTYCQEYKDGVVTICEIMGRNAGWLTGAAALVDGRDAVKPDLIYLPEVDFDVDAFMKKVGEILEKKPFVVVAISEGIHNSEGTLISEFANKDAFVDSFGHRQLTGTANYLARLVKDKYGSKTRAVELSLLQRAASHISSRADITEAFSVGKAAVKAGYEGKTGVMAAYTRITNEPYLCAIDFKDVHSIANAESMVPRDWINEEGTYVNEKFIAYAKPLIQGELAPLYLDGVPAHLPMPEELKVWHK